MSSINKGEKGEEQVQVVVQGIEFLNYENVCQAEKDILLNIIRGADSKEYSKGLFAFDTPFNDGDLECGQGEGEEISPQPNGCMFAMASIPAEAGIVSQTGPQHGVPPYYAGQAHLPVAASATSGPIPSVGAPPMTNNPSGNPMLMYTQGIPQMMAQPQYYAGPPPFYPGSNQHHLSYIPVDNSVSDNYIPHTSNQNHHKSHDSHHSSGLYSTSGGQGTNPPYGKGRRKHPPPQPNFYFNPAHYYPVPPYYNQQQLQNVTGQPIIVPPVYLHPQTMFAQGPMPSGNEMDHHHSMSSQSIVSVPSDMTFAQSPGIAPPPPSHTTPASTNNSMRSSASNSSVNDAQSLQQPSPDSLSSEQASTGQKSGPSKNTAVDITKTTQEFRNANDTTKAFNKTEKQTLPFTPSPQFATSSNSSTGKSASNTRITNGPESISKPLSDQSSETAETEEAATENNVKNQESVPPKQVNGDISSSEKLRSANRDSISADANSRVEPLPDQPGAGKKSYSSSVSKTSGAKTSNSVSNNAHEGSKITDAVTPTANPPKSVANVVHNESNKGGNRSWASIASVKSATIPVDGASKQNAQISNADRRDSSNGGTVKSGAVGPVALQTMKKDQQMDNSDAMEIDPVAFRLGEHFVKYALDHQSTPLAPRGLYNQCNSCFLNAILQVLLACPPFVNTFRSLSHVLEKNPSKSSPMIQSVYEFVREFSPLVRATATKKDKSRDGFIPGPNLEPSGVRKALALLSPVYQVEGRQEDAEEVLNFILNTLHDEIIKVTRLLLPPKERELLEKGSAGAGVNGVNDDTQEQEVEDNGSGAENQWQEVGAKNRSCLTRRTTVNKSPISEAFLGQMCSWIQNGQVKIAHLEPFYALPLAIQHESIKSVKDALEAMAMKEEVHNLTLPGGIVGDGWKTVMLEELPPILVLHLKRFVYEKNGIRKISKKLDYSVDLEIGKELLSSNCKSKYSPKQRQYKLFAVVYHDGEEANKGHYVADCFHPSGGSLWGNWGWLRYDDTSVKPVSEAAMLNPISPRVPYLLLYRRQDTIQQQNKKGS